MGPNWRILSNLRYTSSSLAFSNLIRADKSMHTPAFPHFPFSKTHRPSQPSTPWIAFKDNYVFLHFFFQLTPISCPTEFSGFNPMLLFLPTRRFWGRSTFTVTVPTVFQRTESQIPKLQMSKLTLLHFHHCCSLQPLCCCCICCWWQSHQSLPNADSAIRSHHHSRRMHLMGKRLTTT